jgi:hypothetical protein
MHMPVDVIVTDYGFAKRFGLQLRVAIKVVRPDLRIVVICQDDDRTHEHELAADILVRPTHFFSDLSQGTG